MSTGLLDELRAGRTALGFALTYSAPGFIEAAGRGWDWVWIDGQHGQHDYASLLASVRVGDACGLGSIVRVPSHDGGIIGRVMDMAPAGIMVPMVDNAQQARRIVEAGRFAPLGSRSYGGRRAVDLGGRGYYESANTDVLVVAQIETPEAVGNAREIAGTNGVDVLFFGADDMKVRLGIPIDTSPFESPELIDAMRTTAAAAADAGKLAGCVAATAAGLKAAVGMGYRLLACGADVSFLRAAAAQQLATLHEVLDGLEA